RDEPARFGKISLRPGMPLQSTMLDLSKLAASLFQVRGFQPNQLHDLKVDVAVLYDPAMHGTVDRPDLAGADPAQRAFLVMEGNKSSWHFDPTKDVAAVVQQAATDAKVRERDRAAIYSFAVHSTEVPMGEVNVPQASPGSAKRVAALAGAFYSADPDELAAEVSRLWPSSAGEKKPWRAAMVPHAGLKYSGGVAAAVLDRIEIPDTIIVIGPKHTRRGVEWAVSPHECWLIPGREIASNQELAQQLAERIPDLELDAGAHAREHCIEVELPLIARAAPAAKVVGIAIGGGDLDRCREFAEGLADVLRQRDERVLLLISSDMNHFANDSETRRLDELALAALDNHDPAALLSIVQENHISMCGVLPAVIVLETLERLQPIQEVERVAYATTADVTHDTSRVVGYAGMLFA
ncbi:MAG: AmmeMemoRadiSam system protein B, partial [Planctomycetales bacterium]|nr:AmmeMemoRadiSam system protein B [Planctomycetales bacterium]